MTPQVIRSRCSAAAKRLRSAAASSTDPQVLLLCAKGLEEMAEDTPGYTLGVNASLLFLEELCETVGALSLQDNPPPEQLHDAAFSLLECLAVISRESCLRQGKREISPAQAAILRYFETSGQWLPDDNTLASEYYYLRIPQAMNP